MSSGEFLEEFEVSSHSSATDGNGLLAHRSYTLAVARAPVCALDPALVAPHSLPVLPSMEGISPAGVHTLEELPQGEM